MREKPGFANIAHAFSGLSYLAGEPGRPPVVPGSTSLADYVSGVWGCVGVMMADGRWIALACSSDKILIPGHAGDLVTPRPLFSDPALIL